MWAREAAFIKQIQMSKHSGKYSINISDKKWTRKL